MASEYQDIFVQVALRLGFVSPSELRECFAELRRQRGARRSLIGILRDKNYLTREQLEDIRREMDREGVRFRVAGFELIERIGRGGMGTVYRALQISLNRIVALKLLSAHLSGNARFLERFRREGRLAARLDHPNVVQVYDVGEANGIHYIAMEYVEGESLGRRIAREGPLLGGEVIRIGRAVAAALGRAEEAAIVHRDVKPSNILLGVKGEVKLADLGLARQAALDETTLRDEGTTLGTPSYMSPEQALGKTDVDIRSDIYSLGATLYHAGGGGPPFTGENPLAVLRQHAESIPVPLRERCPAISADLSNVIDRMLAKKPEQRYQHPSEVIEALEAAGRSEVAEAARPAATRRPFPPEAEAAEPGVRKVLWTIVECVVGVPALLWVIVSAVAGWLLVPLLWLSHHPWWLKTVGTAAILAANPFVWWLFGFVWRKLHVGRHYRVAVPDEAGDGGLPDADDNGMASL